MEDSDQQLRHLSREVERLSAEVHDLRRRLDAAEGRDSAEVSPQSANSAPFGLTAVNRIGALTLAIGVIFFFKYAVDSAWIGQTGRIALGVAAGVALILAAEWLRARSQTVFSQGIAGCGLATLYITCYAAFAWYERFSQGTAMAALAAVSALAVLLSLRYAHPAIAALGFTGGILTPILLQRDPGGVILVLLYLCLIDVTSALIASRWKWTSLAVIVGMESALAALFLTRSTQRDLFTAFALAMSAVRLGLSAASHDNPRLQQAFFATGHGFIVLGLLREVDLWTQRLVALPERRGAESEFSSLFLAAYGIAALAFGIARGSTLVRTLGLVLISIVIGKLYLWDVWFLERLYRMSAFGVLGILLLAASWIYSRSGAQTR